MTNSAKKGTFLNFLNNSTPSTFMLQESSNAHYFVSQMVKIIAILLFISQTTYPARTAKMLNGFKFEFCLFLLPLSIVPLGYVRVFTPPPLDIL